MCLLLFRTRSVRYFIRNSAVYSHTTVSGVFVHGPVCARVRRSLVIAEQPAKHSQQHDALRVTQVVQKANNITAKVRLLLPWHAYYSLVARPELPGASASAFSAAAAAEPETDTNADAHAGPGARRAASPAAYC